MIFKFGNLDLNNNYCDSFGIKLAAKDLNNNVVNIL